MWGAGVDEPSKKRLQANFRADEVLLARVKAVLDAHPGLSASWVWREAVKHGLPAVEAAYPPANPQAKTQTTSASRKAA
jgi:hypothetical protein